MTHLSRCLLAVLLTCTAVACADPARFDLAGPKIDVRVNRAGVTLPIAAVPNLQPGDQLLLHPDLPPTQSVHYLLIVAFLRGTTNPPPDSWFTRIETWKKEPRTEGVSVTVPAEAQQAILFLAPETGGDFSTLRSAVQGRPGIFVRASQDLTEAGFEQARIEKYLNGMKQVPPSDQAALLEHSTLLARTLNLRPNQECFKRPLDQQYTCLTQTGTQTLLDDGHGQSLVAALSTGANSDFINAASNTSLAGGGTYSAYVGALVDLVRVMNSFHTAQYQYIPAIALPEAQALNLRLNTPPSFHNPKSVIVIGLPAVQAAVPPPLRPADPKHVSCLLDPHLVLPVEGAPLVFSTAFAHDLRLTLDAPGTPATVLTADAFLGGMTMGAPTAPRRELPLQSVALPGKTPAPPATPVPATKQQPQIQPGQTVTGHIEGMWGFDHFTGPALLLQQTPGEGWHLVGPAETAVIVGVPNPLELQATGTACLQSLSLEPGTDKLPWTVADASAPNAPQPIHLTLTLKPQDKPGARHLAIQQFGSTKPDEVGLTTFAQPAKLEALRLHAGDATAQLTGDGLDAVISLSMKSFNYAPGTRASGRDMTLTLVPGGSVPAFKTGDRVTAQVRLQDGRTLPIDTTVLPPRPAVTLLRKRIVASTAETPHLPIELGSPDELPLGAVLTFSLKSKASFARAEKIEVALATESTGETNAPQQTMLTVANGGLVLADAHTVLATFDPLKTFGASSYGSLRLRAVAEDGTEGEWLPLATVVRLPVLNALDCQTDPAAICTLNGSSLFLIDAVATDATFATPTPVPDGFVDAALPVARPAGPILYLKLRDDPTVIQRVALPALKAGASRHPAG